MTPFPDQHAGGTSADRVIDQRDGVQELRAIREALDGIRGDPAWWINNRRDQWLPVQHITTMPAQMPAPEDRSSDLYADARSSARCPPATAPRTHPPALPVESHDEETQFCCEAPDLQRTGDPHFPGVACMNCGYIVADCGSVVMQASPHADPDPEPKAEQRGLFEQES